MVETDKKGGDVMTHSQRPAAAPASRLPVFAFAVALAGLGVGLAALIAPFGPNPEKIVALEKKQSAVSQVALALAANQLHAAVLSGAPYNNEMALVKVLGGTDSSLAAPLAALAAGEKTGIPSIRRIVNDFEQIAARVLIDESTGADASWWGQTVGRISALSNALMMEAKVNPFNSQVAPIIKDMQTAIAAGQFNEAMEMTSALPDAARGNFAPWSDLVKLRTDAIIAAGQVASQASRSVKR